MNLTSGKHRLVMVGAFPPPVHGMAAVNEAVKHEIQEHVDPVVINWSATSLRRSVIRRLGRSLRVAKAFYRFWRTDRCHNGCVYVSASGGLGQLYEGILLRWARARRMKVVLHHHSFAYLSERSRLAAWLTRMAGPEAIHVTQSPRMAERLEAVYGAKNVLPISNAVFLLSAKNCTERAKRTQVRTVGFISNICREKGIFDFLDMMAALVKEGYPVQGIVAGPFQDDVSARHVRAQLALLPTVRYVGPVYGADKDRFFSEIDVLVFPTRYAHETEGLVNHEALSNGVPVVAYGRGCIPEIVGPECGRVVDPAEPFVPAAVQQLARWLADPVLFEAASEAAGRRFERMYAENRQSWSWLLAQMTATTAALSRSSH